MRPTKQFNLVGKLALLALVVAAFGLAMLTSMGVAASKKEWRAGTNGDKTASYRRRTMYRKLTPEEERVIVRKGTERPFTGKYNQHFEKGAYTCRRCGTELFESSSKFRSDCGWPSFDEQIPGRVRWQPDPDGMRTEITCATCGAHLGHIFLGEGYTEKNTRYCVNSISMDFIPAEQRTQKAQDPGQDAVGADPRARPNASGQPQGVAPTSPQSAIRNPQSQERALFASGCFWGTEYHLQRAPGVLSTTVGYTGGRTENPTYKQVCTGRTGHAETVEVIYDPAKTSYEQLAGSSKPSFTSGTGRVRTSAQYRPKSLPERGAKQVAEPACSGCLKGYDETKSPRLGNPGPPRTIRLL
jgi:methionine-R-sulfoxide reductase